MFGNVAKLPQDFSPAKSFLYLMQDMSNTAIFSQNNTKGLSMRYTYRPFLRGMVTNNSTVKAYIERSRAGFIHNLEERGYMTPDMERINPPEITAQSTANIIAVSAAHLIHIRKFDPNLLKRHIYFTAPS